MRFLTLVWFGACLVITNDGWSKTKSRGEVILSARAFSPDNDAQTEDIGLAVDARLEVKSRVGNWRQLLSIFTRAGALDKDRSTIFVEDAWIGYRGSRVEFRLGAEVVNWTATEAFHPADVVNSRNLDSDFENAEKRGEPMGSVRIRFLDGGLSAYFLPARIEPLFPGPRSRLNLSGGRSLGRARWAEADGTTSESQLTTQWALRLDQTIGSADVAVHYVRHNDRGQPAIGLSIADQSVIPIFGRVDRVGLTYTQAIGEWLFKVEADHRVFDALQAEPSLVLIRDLPVDHTAVATGLEWGWGYADGGEGTVLAETQIALVEAVSSEEMTQLGPFQRDVLIGYRHAFNDVSSTECTAGLIVDLQQPDEVLGTLMVSRRLSDVWSAAWKARVINAPDENSFLHPYHELYSTQVDITRHF